MLLTKGIFSVYGNPRDGKMVKLSGYEEGRVRSWKYMENFRIE